LLRNLSKFITQAGLYCSKQLETTLHQFCEKPLHITFNKDKLIMKMQTYAKYFTLIRNKKSPARGLTVIAASVHGLLWPTRNHNHKLLASASTEIKCSGFS